MGNYIHVSVGAATLAENKIWISCSDYNGLFSFDLQNEKMTFEHRFQNVGDVKNDLHSNLAYYNGKLYIFPMTDRSVRIYHDKTKEEIVIPVPDKFEYRTCESTIIGGKAYMYSNNNELFCFDMEKERFDNRSDLFELLSGVMADKTAKYVMKSKEKKIFILNDKDKKITVIDDKYVTAEIDVSGINGKVSNITFAGDRLWATLFGDWSVYAIDVLSGELQEYPLKDGTDREKVTLPYYGVCECNGELIVLNYYARKLKKIDQKSKSVTSFDVELSYEVCKECGPMYSMTIKQNDSVYILPNRGGDLLICRGKRIREVVSGVEKEHAAYLKDVLNDFKEGGILVENEKIGVELLDYINLIL